MNKLFVSSAPHIRSDKSIKTIMWAVIAALSPVIVASIIFFGAQAVRVILLSIVFCVATEWFFQRIMKRPSIISDGSAVITGILFACNIPPTSPWWLIAAGSFFAIGITKQLFGGLGYNIFNPALIGRAVVLAAYPVHMTTWTAPFDATTCATPLAIVKEKLLVTLPSYWDLFIGNVGGSLGETSALAILIGGAFLIARGLIRWEVPTVYILTVFAGSALAGRDPLFEILAGGLFLGAFFMITDMVTSPITRKGSIIMALGAGIIVVVIRNWGGYPEGVCYSIIIMNAFVPIIDRYIKPRILGKRKPRVT